MSAAASDSSSLTPSADETVSIGSLVEEHRGLIATFVAVQMLRRPHTCQSFMLTADFILTRDRTFVGDDDAKG